MEWTEEALERVVVATAFSGVVRIDGGDGSPFTKAYGSAHRGHQIPNTVDTRFGIASGTKSLTALAVMSLVEEGRLSLATPARAVLGEDLPLIDDDVTVEHLLGHRSGIGDYFDEESHPDINAYAMNAPVHELAATEQYLQVLDGYPTKFKPGERFSYCNSGYVVLALIAERVSGTPFCDLVRLRVTQPAGMQDTEFLRSDEPDGRVALGYLGIEGLRTNIFHLPVRGSGDGGIYSTVDDISTFWEALFAHHIVSAETLAAMVRPRSDMPEVSMRYGLGFWLTPTGDGVILEGFDAGVRFRSVHDPGRSITNTMISNGSEGAWPLTLDPDRPVLSWE